MPTKLIYQPQTWVCGNDYEQLWSWNGFDGRLVGLLPLGREIRAPNEHNAFEQICVDVVDEFFNRIGVKTT